MDILWLTPFPDSFGVHPFGKLEHDYWAWTRQKRLVATGAGTVTSSTGWVMDTVAWSNQAPFKASAACTW